MSTAIGRYIYKENGFLKEFTTFEEMREWAKDQTHNGVYSISIANGSQQFRREEIIDFGVKE
jgi:hypothetical protein